MVGVPGRSKGCNTCIRRKIKCDQAKPCCGNCIKSRRQCAGYTRKRGYVFSENVSLAASDMQSLKKEESTITHHGRWKAAAKAPSRQAGTMMAAHYQPLVWDTSCPPSDEDTSLPISPSSSTSSSSSSPLSYNISAAMAFRQQLYHVFVDSYMPSEGSARSKYTTTVTGNWLAQLQIGTIDSPALDSAVTAYAISQIGRRNSDDKMVAQSRDMYAQGIEQLRTALRRRSTRLADHTLAACMALSVYEISEGSSDGDCAYKTHIMGAMALLEMRGPESCTSPLAHSLFLGLRRQTLLGSLINRRDTILCQPDWRSKPWRVYPKNPLDECIDLLFDLTPVLQKSDQVFRETDESGIRTDCEEVIQMCNKIITGLQEWRERFDASMNGSTYWPTFSNLESRLDIEKTGKLYPVSFQFASFFLAYVLTMYWSGAMVVHDVLTDVYKKLATIDPSPSLTSKAREHREIWVGMVRNICQSVEYLVEGRCGKVSLHLAISILRGCLGCLDGEGEVMARERAWVEEMLDDVSDKLNLRVKRALWQ